MENGELKAWHTVTKVDHNHRGTFIKRQHEKYFYEGINTIPTRTDPNGCYFLVSITFIISLTYTKNEKVKKKCLSFFL